MATDQPPTDHDPDTPRSESRGWTRLDVDGLEIPEGEPKSLDERIVETVSGWDEQPPRQDSGSMDGVEVTTFADPVRRWMEPDPPYDYLSFVPRTPEQIERSRAMWAEMAAALNRLLPEIKAASEKILADADRLADGQRLGNAIGRVIVDETHAWPPYTRRASGRITWARPVGRML